ncbi:MAG: hypothetical protein GF308_05280 [Candidatus Heimdallarchaeota archaeon]|nr:hypothetical protein [Candidatus Heimdallarchaeota archaeon]
MKRQMKSLMILGLITLLFFSIPITATREGENIELLSLKDEDGSNPGAYDKKAINPEEQEFSTHFISEGITKVGEFDDDYGNAYKFSRSGSRLYVAGLDGGISVVNINNPDKPVVLGNFWDGGSAYEATISGTTIFVADGTDGLEILDASDVTNIQKEKQYYDGGTCYDLAFVGYSIIYAADGSDGLEIFEYFSNGTLMKRGSYTTGITNCFGVSVDILNNLAFLSCGSDGIIVLDTLNPYEPEYMTTLDHSNSDARSVRYTANTLFVADGEAGFRVYNYSNEDNILLSDEFPISQGVVENVFWQLGDIVYVAAGTEGVYCLNTTDINNVTQISQTTFKEGYVHDVLYFSNNLFIANNLNIKVLNLASLVNPSIRTSLTYAGQPNQLAVSEEVGLLANGIVGLDIINITDPANPIIYSKYQPENVTFYDVEIINSTIFCATNLGLEMIDISDLTSPVKLKAVEVGTTRALALASDYAFLLTTTQEMAVVDISNPFTASEVARISLANNGLDISIEGTTAYLATGASGFQIIDITTPTNPTIVTTKATSNALGICIEGTVVAIADGTTGVKLYNVSNPSVSVDLFSETLNSGSINATKVACKDDDLFVSAMENGAYHLNISDPTNISLLGHFNDGGNANAVGIQESLIYIADDKDSFEILGRDTDGDEIADYNEDNIYGTDKNNPDTDGDGLNDGFELNYWENRSIDPLDDLDGDGLGHLLDPDSDNDTLLDGDEVNVYNTDPLDPDTDGDGLTDDEEITLGSDGFITDPTNEDTDSDGLGDYEEIFTYKTNATNPDSDFDGPFDGWEITYNFNPLINDSYFDNDTDDLDAAEEFIYNTDPFNEDTDDDGLTDGEEVKLYSTDPTNEDTDGDFIDDKWEIDNSLNPLDKTDAQNDPDGDGLVNYDEYFYRTDPNDVDSDGDGLEDKWEVYHGTNPVLADQNDDDDNDGLTNLEEFQEGTHPNDPDTDDDGFTDFYELESGSDPLDPNDYPITTPFSSPTGMSIWIVIPSLSLAISFIVLYWKRSMKNQ